MAGKNLDFSNNYIEREEVVHITNVIEHNLHMQTNAEEGYTAVTWSNGLPVKKETYTDDTRATKLWTREYEFTNGVPTRIVITNEDEGDVLTKEITWANGVPTEINMV